MSERSVLMTIMNEMKRTGTHNEQALKAPNRRSTEFRERKKKPWSHGKISIDLLDSQCGYYYMRLQKRCCVVTIHIGTVNEALATDERTKKHRLKTRKRQFCHWLNLIFCMNTIPYTEYWAQSIFMLIWSFDFCSAYHFAMINLLWILHHVKIGMILNWSISSV